MIPLLEQALVRRKDLINLSDTDCFRLFDGEGVPGLSIEKLGPNLWITLQEGIALDPNQRESILAFSTEHLKPQQILLRSHPKDRTQLASRTEVLWGPPALAPWIVLENGVQYEIRPEEPHHSGLFLDQRENRRRVAQAMRGKRLLNLFAFSCSFSVAAAKVGAETTSVDLSPKVLEWGKSNFRLNGLTPEQYAFYPWDAFEFLQHAIRKGRQFDGIVLDPPSFSRGREGKKTFSVVKDLPKLLQLSEKVLAPGGRLWVSSNYSGWDKPSFLRKLTQALPGKRVAPPSPMDFPNHPVLAAECFGLTKESPQ